MALLRWRPDIWKTGRSKDRKTERRERRRIWKQRTGRQDRGEGDGSGLCGCDHRPFGHQRGPGLPVQDPAGASWQGRVGVRVLAPFGRGDTLRKGYVVSLSHTPSFAQGKAQSHEGGGSRAVSVQEQMICLAWWMKEQYRATMNQALKTVMPVKSAVAPKRKRPLWPCGPGGAFRALKGSGKKRNIRPGSGFIRRCWKTGSCRTG